MPRVRIPNNWQPRWYQKPLWSYLENGGRRALCVWHRRAGKDDVALHWGCVAGHQRVGTYWHMLPEYEQARKAIWNAVDPHTGQRRIDIAFPHELRANTNEQSMFIRFKNNSTWQVVGSDNYDSLVGTPPVGITFSEWALSKPSTWAYLAPILLENNGWAVFITTPRGKNHVHGQLKMAEQDPAWFAEVVPIDVTKAVSPEAIEQQRKEYASLFGQELADAMIEQEFYCSFNAAVPGAYYASLITKAEREGRVEPLPHRPDLPVHTAWDLGIGDDTSIWFAQRVGGWVHIIDHYATNGQPASHYVEHLKSKPYTYGEHFLPHDASNREWANGQKRIDVLRSLGLENIKVLGRIPLDDGINAVRNILPVCRFDAVKCAEPLESLRQYRRDYDEERRVFRPTPLHDWTSHDADAFRYLATGLSPEAAEPVAPKRYTPARQRWRQGGQVGTSWMAN